VNISLLSIVLLTAGTIGQPPFNVIQLLWINLIMDILGSISICTEPYKPNEAFSPEKSQRISRNEYFITRIMWRTILTQVTYQLLVMIVLVYLGPFFIVEHSFNLITTDLRLEGNIPSERLKLNTIVFHTFVLMNIFNSINCRTISANDMNVFKTICNNPIFVLVFAIEAGVQSYMVYAAKFDLGTAILGTAELTPKQLITCWSLGAFSLAVNAISKMIPVEKFSFVNIDLEHDDCSNFVTRFYSVSIDSYQRQKDNLAKAVADRD
jgi:Ca2+-transporting ATPase